VCVTMTGTKLCNNDRHKAETLVNTFVLYARKIFYLIDKYDRPFT